MTEILADKVKLKGGVFKIVPSGREGRSGLVLTPEEIELQEEFGKRMHRTGFSNFALFLHKIFKAGPGMFPHSVETNRTYNEALGHAEQQQHCQMGLF